MKYVRFGSRVYMFPRHLSHAVFVAALGGGVAPASAGYVAHDVDGFLYAFGHSESLGLMPLWDDAKVITEQLGRP